MFSIYHYKSKTIRKKQNNNTYIQITYKNKCIIRVLCGTSLDFNKIFEIKYKNGITWAVKFCDPRLMRSYLVSNAQILCQGRNLKDEKILSCNGIKKLPSLRSEG